MVLLENESAIPRRYAAVASLMEADIKPLKTDSLDEIARLMEDIERRLKLARAGKRVRQQEDDVVAKLDKMIEKMEEQKKQQQQPKSCCWFLPFVINAQINCSSCLPSHQY